MSKPALLSRRSYKGGKKSLGGRRDLWGKEPVTTKKGEKKAGQEKNFSS